MQNASRVNCGLIGLGTVGSATVDFFAPGPLEAPLALPQLGAAAAVPIYLWSASRRTRPGAAGEAILRRVLAQAGDGPPRFYYDTDPADPASRFNPGAPSWRKIVQDPDVDIVVEVTGSPVAEAIIQEALWSGKSVVTANKRVMSRSGYELMRLAERRGAVLAFEASVGGGMPIVQTIGSSIGGNVTALLAIINGTTNFILSEMVEGARKANTAAEAAAVYPAALAAAVKRGLAEADPSDDVLGEDPRSKLIILAGLAFGVRLRPADVYARGIARKGTLTRQSIFHAADLGVLRELGLVPKLLAGAQRVGARVVGWVQPAALPAAHALAGVRDSENACLLQAQSPTSTPAGPKCYEIMLRGPGAGGPETASSVISDIRFCARQLAGRVSPPLHESPVYNYGSGAFSRSQDYRGAPSLMESPGLVLPFLLRFVLTRPSPEARRSLADALRRAGLDAAEVPAGGAPASYAYVRTAPVGMAALEAALGEAMSACGAAGLSMDILYVPLIEGAAWAEKG